MHSIIQNLPFIFPIYLSLASRLHGGGFISLPRVSRNILYSLPYLLFGPVAFISAYIGKNLGHEEFWNMGSRKSEVRWGFLALFVDTFTRLKRDSLPWCVSGMAVKGFIISTGTYDWIIIVGHMISLPVSYFIGMRVFKLNNEIAEYLSGFLCGLSMLVSILMR